MTNSLYPDHAAAIAARITIAKTNFAQTVQEISGCSAEEAAKITAYYLQNKIATLHANSARITVKHGMFLDREVLTNAVAAVYAREGVTAEEKSMLLGGGA